MATQTQRVARIVHPSQTMQKNKRVLTDVLAALAKVDVGHALIGGLAVNYYGNERSTSDVDLLVSKRSAKRICAELERRGYAVEVHPDMIRLYVPKQEKSVADLLWYESHQILRAAVSRTVFGIMLGQSVRLVQRGALVALKYHAAIDAKRGGRRYQDVADIDSVLTKQFGPADEKLAVSLAEKIYPGGGEGLVRFLDDLRHGRQITI